MRSKMNATIMTLIAVGFVALVGCTADHFDHDMRQPIEAHVTGTGPWVDEDITKGTFSEPIMIAGKDRRFLHLAHRGDKPVNVALEYESADGTWQRSEPITLRANSWGFQMLEDTETRARLRIVALDDISQATVWLTYVANAEMVDELEPLANQIWTNQKRSSGRAY